MSDWFARLLPGDTPVFDRTLRALVELMPRRDKLPAREVAHEVLADPFATLLLIHAINKKLGQRYGTEVTTVEHAVMMQGIGAYLEAARGLASLERSPAGKDARTLKALHVLTRRAQHAAWQARDFAVLHSDVHAEEVQVAAILHHLPEMLLWLRAPDQALRLRELERSLPAEEAACQVLGEPMQSWRLRLLEAWSIPELSRDLLDQAQAERPRQIILATCLDIARRSERGWWDEVLLADYQALADLTHLPLEQVIFTVHANAGHAARGGDWLTAPAAAAWIPMLPGEWPEEAEADTAAAAPSQQTAVAQGLPGPASSVTRTQAAPLPAQAAAEAPPSASAPVARQDPVPAATPASPPTSNEHVACPMPDKAVFQDTMRGIEAHLDGSYNLNQMSALILKGLHSGLGLTRILFAMVTPDGERVKSRFTLGIPAEDPLRHFEFRLDGKDLFAQLMGKMQGVWINDGNRDRLWPMVAPRLQGLIGAGDFYAMSLFSGSRPVGLIYADRGHGECGLDPLTYTDFKMFCLQAARGLGRIKG